MNNPLEEVRKEIYTKEELKRFLRIQFEASVSARRLSLIIIGKQADDYSAGISNGILSIMETFGLVSENEAEELKKTI